MTYSVYGGTGKLVPETQTFGSYMDRWGTGMVGMLTSIMDTEVDPGHYIYVTDLPIDPGGEDSILTYLTCLSFNNHASQFVAIQDNAEYDNSEYTCIHREVPISTQFWIDDTNDLSLTYPTTFTNNYKVRWKFRVNSDAISRPLQYQNVLYMLYPYFQACWYIGIYTYVRLQEDVIEGWTYHVYSMQESARFGGAVGMPGEGGGST
jgi:hypothetical protein